MPITVDAVMGCAAISVPLQTFHCILWKISFEKKKKPKWKYKVKVYHRQSSNFNLKINNICGEIVYFQNGFMAKQSPLAMYTVRLFFSSFSQQTCTTKKNKQTAQSYWINHFVEYVIWISYLYFSSWEKPFSVSALNFFVYPVSIHSILTFIRLHERKWIRWNPIIWHSHTQTTLENTNALVSMKLFPIFVHCQIQCAFIIALSMQWNEFNYTIWK